MTLNMYVLLSSRGKVFHTKFLKCLLTFLIYLLLYFPKGRLNSSGFASLGFVKPTRVSLLIDALRATFSSN